MSKKLDPEGLGIILLNAFMDEFFPEEKRSTPDTFDLLHYNGIPRSNVENRVNEIDFLIIKKRIKINKKIVPITLGKISSGLCNTIGKWFTFCIDIESNVNMFANQMAEHWSELDRTHAIIELTKNKNINQSKHTKHQQLHNTNQQKQLFLKKWK